MIERIIELSIRNRVLVLLAAAVLSVLGCYAVLQTPVDAIPDLSENQVIVFTDWPGRSPREIEDQVTSILTRKLQGLAGIQAVRSSSEFNFSMITVIFEDRTDFYFARQRVSEKLAQAGTFLPAGVVPYLAPDATALGQIYWYTVENSAERPQDPGRLWAINKFYIAPQLNAAAGVADVAVVGGMPLEYQVDVRPDDLRAYGVTLGELYAAVSQSNMPSGGGVIQKNNAEYIVRGVGWITSQSDLENTIVKEIGGTPIYVKSLASVQLGVQFRRSVYEKDGNEVTGGVVLMRHGENPLAVTDRVKAKIRELQPGLPDGVHIVPAYDRTRLITGAIATLTDVMAHEMLIASLAILAILLHVRSVLVICITLPLAVLFSFLMMWLLRVTGVIDIQANIMSLAGITISIGVLVDQAIVMTENATHRLKQHFGERRVTGDIRELVIEPCCTVGRPIFFSVLIMLLSFVPVFMLSGREGRLFHPLAFTKSFAMLGVALISITVVPALIPAFLKGHLRSEEDNPIVRSFIRIYKPLLTWALPRRNLVMWMFAALLVLAAGMFPLQALLGLGASESAWRTSFLGVFAVVTALTVGMTRGAGWQALSLASLVAVGLWSYGFQKIGVAFVPALDEGTILDMPVTVPRASITQTADDLKARDALLRGFPEVESVIGKSGRADTPTDPAPLDMVETFVNFRPAELWPKRVLNYADAARHSGRLLDELERAQFLAPLKQANDRSNLVNSVAQTALVRFDETMRTLALRRYQEVETELESTLTRLVIAETVAALDARADRAAAASDDAASQLASELASELTAEFGRWLARNPSWEDVAALSRRVEQRWSERQGTQIAHDGLEMQLPAWRRAARRLREQLGGRRASFADHLLQQVNATRHRLWLDRVHEINWELHDYGADAFTWIALQELALQAQQMALVAGAAREAETRAFVDASASARLDAPLAAEAAAPLTALRERATREFSQSLFLWPRKPGPAGDLVEDEMRRVLQTPGWVNIFTQPIYNRIEMLSTGVRTDIGVKVFGPDLETIEQTCKRIEQALKPIRGARDVLAAPIAGKGYVQIDIRRQDAARYGISVEDIQREIEVALGGRAVTFTVEKRERFPVRVRYARASRNDEDSIRRLLVSPGATSQRAEEAAPTVAAANFRPNDSAEEAGAPAHAARAPHAARARPHIPLSEIADVRIVEGPAMIRSENGRLVNYVTLNVRGRDIVGFVDEAQRTVAQTVPLAEGASLAWSGEFEHQVRAAQTLRIVFPVVIALIFIVLYFTYNDLADAALMMLAVPEALAGGAFFMYLFPKIMHGWSAAPVDFSVAVWVGFIACFGMATETGIIMLVYLREAIEKRGGLEKIGSLEELRQAVIEGAVHRLRPKLLTEGVAIIAIFPMVFSRGVGGEILAPMALPVLGGLLISDEVVDLFLPVRFYWVRRGRWLKLRAARQLASPACPSESVAASAAIMP